MYNENLAELLQEQDLEVACVAFPSSPRWPNVVFVVVYRKTDRVPVQGYAYSNVDLSGGSANYLAARTAGKLHLRTGGETDLDVIKRSDLPIIAATAGGLGSASARDAILVVAATEYLIKIGVLERENEELPPIPGNIH